MRYDVVIPVGGKGGQMYPLTAAMPKTLLPIEGEPLLVRILRSLDVGIFHNALIVCNEYRPLMVLPGISGTALRDLTPSKSGVLSLQKAP